MMDDRKQREVDAAWAEWEALRVWRSPLTHDLRLRLAEAQNWRCCWAMFGCTVRMEPTKGQPDSATFEHVIPAALGGTDHVDNIAIACLSCNQIRGNRTGVFVPRTAP